MINEGERLQTYCLVPLWRCRRLILLQYHDNNRDQPDVGQNSGLYTRIKEVGRLLVWDVQDLRIWEDVWPTRSMSPTHFDRTLYTLYHRE
jgi:hypothetical protein